MRRSLLILVAAMFMAGSLPIVAQVPTAEQLELLRSMSPEDREALLEQLGLGGAVMGDSTGGAGGEGSDATRRGRTSRDTDDRSRSDQTMTAERLKAEMALKPDDSVLIDIDFKKDKP